MRIAFLTFEIPDVRPGGVGAYTLKCAAALAAGGHEPHLFTLSIPAANREHFPAGVHLHEVADVAERVADGSLAAVLGAVALNGTQAAYKLSVGVLLCDALRREHQVRRFDIVEAAECEALALPLILGPIADLPVVVQIHLGYAANAWGNGISDGGRDHLAEGLELASIIGADGVCAATGSVVDVTRRLCPFKREVSIVPHPVRVGAEAPAPAPVKGAVLFVGRLQRRKGCEILAAAADIFLRRRPSATIRIVGSDTRAGGESMLARMMGRVDAAVRDRFIYIGELSQAEIRREIEGCRFQVVPSLVENFANTAIDAMALGRMVIYGGNTGLDEVVGEAGARVWPLTAEELAKAMEAAWDDHAMTADYGLRGYQRISTRFDAATITGRRVEFYEKVIAERDGRVPEWDALSAAQIQAILRALVGQSRATLGLPSEIPTPGRMLLVHLTKMAERLNRPPVVWLFGAGRYTTRLLGEKHLWESAGFAVAGIVDEHPRFGETPTYLGLAVKSPQQLCEEITGGARVDAIILATDALEEVFRRRSECFRELGIEILAAEMGALGFEPRTKGL